MKLIDQLDLNATLFSKILFVLQFMLNGIKIQVSEIMIFNYTKKW